MILYKNPTPELIKLAKDTFGYEGKDYRVIFCNKYIPQHYWSEGNIRKFVYIICGEDKNDITVRYPDSKLSNPFNPEASQQIIIFPGVFILELEKIGNKEHITVYFREDGLSEDDKNKIIQESSNIADSLSLAEKIVLLAHCSLKSSYAGISDYRKHEAMRDTGIPSEIYEAAKQSLKDKGLITNRNAVTKEARNVRNSLGIRQLWNIKYVE